MKNLFKIIFIFNYLSIFPKIYLQLHSYLNNKFPDKSVNRLKHAYHTGSSYLVSGLLEYNKVILYFLTKTIF